MSDEEDVNKASEKGNVLFMRRISQIGSHGNDDDDDDAGGSSGGGGSVRTQPREAPLRHRGPAGRGRAYCSGRVYGVAGRNEPVLAHW